MGSEGKDVEVIVVGAGLAGLSAATQLRRAGKTVLVLEASDRVGGRCKPGEIVGRRIDHGGQWIGAEHHRYRAAAKERGIELAPQFDEGDAMLHRGGRAKSYAGALPPLPKVALAEVALAQRRIAADVKNLPEGALPHRATRSAILDALTVEGWLRRHVRSVPARELLRVAIAAIVCAPLAEVSYLHFLEIVRQGGGLESMVAVAGGAQQDVVVGGAWSLPEALGEELAGALRLGQPVRRIAQDDAGVSVFTGAGGAGAGEFRARRAIVAVPPPLVAEIDFSPALPARRQNLLRRQIMGEVIKVHVAYEAPFWRGGGLSGSALGLDLAIGVVFDAGEGAGDHAGAGVLVALIEAEHATRLADMSTQDRREEVIGDLVAIFGEAAAEPVDYTECVWREEEWARGGYAAHLVPGAITTHDASLAEPHGRVHWAGTEIAREYAGYFEGALESGARAAGEIIRPGGGVDGREAARS